jgi:ketosteroid isomerase-like protein
MRISYILGFFLALSLPAAAAEADQNLKQEVTKISSAYMESFNKKDAAGIAALYASGGVLVNAAGTQSDIAKYYESVFKAGFDHNEITVDQAWPLGADTALAMGDYTISGKNQSGTAMEISGRWTAVDVREGGTLKIRMLTAFPKPPPQAAK